MDSRTVGTREIAYPSIWLVSGAVINAGDYPDGDKLASFAVKPSLESKNRMC